MPATSKQLRSEAAKSILRSATVDHGREKARDAAIAASYKAARR